MEIPFWLSVGLLLPLLGWCLCLCRAYGRSYCCRTGGLYPFSFRNVSTSKSWFNNSCSATIRARDAAYQTLKNSSSSDSHSAFISARNNCKHLIREAKHSFIQKKCDILSCSSTNRSFWSLAKSFSYNFCCSTFPSRFCSDNYTIAGSPTDKATLLGSLFTSKSTLDDYNISSLSDAHLTNPMSLPIISFHAVKKILLSLDRGSE